MITQSPQIPLTIHRTLVYQYNRRHAKRLNYSLERSWKPTKQIRLNSIGIIKKSKGTKFQYLKFPASLSSINQYQPEYIRITRPINHCEETTSSIDTNNPSVYTSIQGNRNNELSDWESHSNNKLETNPQYTSINDKEHMEKINQCRYQRIPRQSNLTINHIYQFNKAKHNLYSKPSTSRLYIYSNHLHLTPTPFIASNSTGQTYTSNKPSMDSINKVKQNKTKKVSLPMSLDARTRLEINGIS